MTAGAGRYGELAALVSGLATAEAMIEAARSLHVPARSGQGGRARVAGRHLCAECGMPHPCDTAQALTPQPAGGDHG